MCTPASAGHEPVILIGLKENAWVDPGRPRQVGRDGPDECAGSWHMCAHTHITTCTHAAACTVSWAG